MIRIARAHSYEDVDRVKQELSVVLPPWLEDIVKFNWYILPDNLSPLYTGLLREDIRTHDGGRWYSECGGWCAWEDHSWLCRETPHIFLRSDSTGSAVHELGHALANVWHVPVNDFFKPDRALYPYAASNADEYFACALDAFLTSSDKLFNHKDIREADPEICEYLESYLKKD